jgi:hypothetical protein
MIWQTPESDIYHRIYEARKREAENEDAGRTMADREGGIRQGGITLRPALKARTGRPREDGRSSRQDIAQGQ